MSDFLFKLKDVFYNRIKYKRPGVSPIFATYFVNRSDDPTRQVGVFKIGATCSTTPQILRNTRSSAPTFSKVLHEDLGLSKASYRHADKSADLLPKNPFGSSVKHFRLTFLETSCEKYDELVARLTKLIGGCRAP